MGKYLLALGAFFFVLPGMAMANDVEGQLLESVWYLDTEVMVNGSHLQGRIPSLAKLCFAPEAYKDNLICFKAGHPNITKWTSSNITFYPPRNAPPLGVLVLLHPYYKSECAIVRQQLSCDSVQERETIEIASYKAHPHIANVVHRDSGEVADALEVGEEYEIQGFRFGDSGKGIFFDKWMIDTTDIVRWTHDSIVIRPSKGYPDMNLLRVHNGAGKGNEWNVLDQYIAHLEQKEVEQQELANQKVEGTATDILAASLSEERIEFFTGSGEVISPFADVALDDPYYNAIAWGKLNKVVGGYEDGTFRPDVLVNRAEFLKIVLEAQEGVDIASASGTIKFKDVDEDEWYTPYIEYAAEDGIVDGYADGTFQPERTLNTAEALKMAYRVFKVPTLDPRGNVWYSRYQEHAQENHILFDETQTMDAPIRRRDVLWIVWRIKQQRSGRQTLISAN